MVKVGLAAGYQRISNPLSEAINYAQFNNSERVLIGILMRETYGWGRKAAAMSVRDFGCRCQLSSRSIERALSVLCDEGVFRISARGSGTLPNSYEIEADPERWGKFSVGLPTATTDMDDGTSGGVAPTLVTVVGTSSTDTDDGSTGTSETATTDMDDGTTTDMNDGTSVPEVVAAHEVTTTLKKERKKYIAPARARRRATQIPKHWTPSEAHRDRALAAGLDAEYEAETFRLHHEAKGSTYVKWDAAFHTWLRKAVEFGRGKKEGGEKVTYLKPGEKFE